MLKRLISLLLVSAIFALLPMQTSAAPTQAETAVYLADGSRITVTVEENAGRDFGVQSGSKTYTYVASDGAVHWKAVLSGTFSYTGTSAVCVSSECDVTIYASNWYLVSKSADSSGNTARATVTMEMRTLGVVTDEVTQKLSLSCDRNGNLS